MKKIITFLFLLLTALTAHAQLPDHIYKPNIHSVKLYKVRRYLQLPGDGIKWRRSVGTSF